MKKLILALAFLLLPTWAFASDKMVISGNNNTVTYMLVDATGAYDSAIKITGTGNTLENDTLYAPSGVGLDADESCTVTNVIMEGNTQDVDVAATKTVTAKNNCLPNHANSGDNIGAGSYSSTNCVFAQSPSFGDASGQDYQLTCGSPCIDSGFATGTSTDLAGNVTPRGSGMDIGCFEMNCMGSSMGMGMGLTGYCPYRDED